MDYDFDSIEITKGDPYEVVAEAFWLAWQACGSAMGMGVFQDRPDATKEAVMENIASHGDYPSGNTDPEGDYRADYVFGRMMKATLLIRGKEIGFPPESRKVNPYYQAWADTYKSYRSLVTAAAKNVGAKFK